MVRLIDISGERAFKILMRAIYGLFGKNSPSRLAVVSTSLQMPYCEMYNVSFHRILLYMLQTDRQTCYLFPHAVIGFFIHRSVV